MEIKENEFKEKIATNKKVIIDCFAPWCGPCKMISPIIDELASELSEYDFYKINIDNAEALAEEYSIMSIPTILIFENGILKTRVTGFKSKEELKEIINR